MSPTPNPLILYRITRAGHDSLFPPSTGRGRFDAEDGSFRVLYTAVDRPAAFAETLQPFRPSLEVRAALASLRFEEISQPPVSLRTWTSGRVLLRIRLPGTANLLDLRTSAIIEQIATERADVLRNLGLTDFDASHLLGPDRRVTQEVAAWAHANDYDGLLAPSRFAAAWTTCAVFNRIRPRILSRDPISPNDPDLISVAKSFNLKIAG